MHDQFKTVKNRVLCLFLVPEIEMGCPKFFLIHLMLPLSTLKNGKQRQVRMWKMCLCLGKKQPTFFAQYAHSAQCALMACLVEIFQVLKPHLLYGRIRAEN